MTTSKGFGVIGIIAIVGLAAIAGGIYYGTTRSGGGSSTTVPVVSLDFQTPPLNGNTVYMPNTILVHVAPHNSSWGTPVRTELYGGMTGSGQGQGSLITTNTSPQVIGTDSVFSFPMNCAQLIEGNPYNNRFNVAVYFSKGQNTGASSVPIDCQTSGSAQWIMTPDPFTVSYANDWTFTPWYYGSAAQQMQGNQSLVGYKFTLPTGNQIWIGGPQNTCLSGEFGIFQKGVSVLACVQGFRAEVLPTASPISPADKALFGEFVVHNPS